MIEDATGIEVNSMLEERIKEKIGLKQ